MTTSVDRAVMELDLWWRPAANPGLSRSVAETHGDGQSRSLTHHINHHMW
jgi:hypothetical protein